MMYDEWAEFMQCESGLKIFFTYRNIVSNVKFYQPGTMSLSIWASGHARTQITLGPCLTQRAADG